VEEEEIWSAIPSDSLQHRLVCRVQDLYADRFLLTFQLKGFPASGAEEIVNLGVVLTALEAGT